MIVLVLSLVGFYVCILVKSKVINTHIIKLVTVARHYIQAYSCIVLVFYTTLDSPSWFLPIVR